MREYEIDSPNGGTFTVQLDDDEAKARGLKAPSVKQAEKPANKARKASNKSQG